MLGTTVGHGPAFKPAEFPAIIATVGAPMAAALSINGVQNELAMWLATGRAGERPEGRLDAIHHTRGRGHRHGHAGPEIFLLSHKDAPTFKVLSVAAGQPLASASVLVPA